MDLVAQWHSESSQPRDRTLVSLQADTLTSELGLYDFVFFVVAVQWLNSIWLFSSSWTASRQAPLSFTSFYDCLPRLLKQIKVCYFQFILHVEAIVMFINKLLCFLFYFSTEFRIKSSFMKMFISIFIILLPLYISSFSHLIQQYATETLNILCILFLLPTTFSSYFDA